jgi:predicted DNA-binding transcriptional regulator AlpA
MSKGKPLIIDLKGLRTGVGLKISRTQLWRWMFDDKYAKNRFPRCRKLGPNHRNARPYWLVEEIIAWLRLQGFEVPQDWAP